jgi:hypothetical protein
VRRTTVLESVSNEDLGLSKNASVLQRARAIGAICEETGKLPVPPLKEEGLPDGKHKSVHE